MQTTVLALALGSAAAFVGPAAQAPATAVNAGQGDLVALAEANGDQLGRNLGFWDPLGASSLDFFGLEQSGRLPSGATTASPTRVMPTSAAPSSSRAVDGAGGCGRVGSREASFAADGALRAVVDMASAARRRIDMPGCSTV